MADLNSDWGDEETGNKCVSGRGSSGVAKEKQVNRWITGQGESPGTAGGRTKEMKGQRGQGEVSRVRRQDSGGSEKQIKTLSLFSPPRSTCCCR